MIGLGTAAIGRPQYINIRPENNLKQFDLNSFIKEGKQLLSVAYENGIRHFDTAPGYGVSEKILLEWLHETKIKDIKISTKWGYTYMADFNLKATVHEVKEHSLEKLNEQWEFSRQFLPFLDLYQVHSATLNTGVLDNREILDRLYEIKTENGIRLGVTTSGNNQNEVITKALSITVNGEELFDGIQVTFNVFEQSLLKVLPMLEGKDIIIKEALANGRVFPNSKYPNYRKHYQLLKELSQKYDVGIDAIALRYCIDMVSPFIVLSGANNESQLLSNLNASKIQLELDDIKRLNKLYVAVDSYWGERRQLQWN